MPGLVPGIHDFSSCGKDVDGRAKPGHDGALNALIPGYDRSRDFTRRAEFRPIASHHLNLP
jgi:hypothetical protein